MVIQDFAPELKARYDTPESHIAVGDLGEKVGEEILRNYEGFDLVEKPKKTMLGQPFDRLCRKEGKWYIVEIKGSKHGIVGTPSHTQKRRMRQVLETIKELEPVLLQIDLIACKYKIRSGKEVRDLIVDTERKRLNIENIINWVQGVIDS